MCPVVVEVAPLAHRPKVLVVAVFRGVVEMGRRQDDPAPALELSELPRTPANVAEPTFALTLTPPAGPAESDPIRDLRPIVWIAIAVIRMDRHVASLG